MSENILDIKNLSITYVTKDLGTCYAVNDVSLSLQKGHTLGLVGSEMCIRDREKPPLPKESSGFCRSPRGM
mgnify:CR=1 FL=1